MVLYTIILTLICGIFDDQTIQIDYEFDTFYNTILLR